jgi:uncharacterized protein YjbI with pentapeptide repeats
MPNLEHVAVLRQGVEAWNVWRQQTLIKPDLSGYDFGEIEGRYFVIDVIDSADLTGINFSFANLENANLSTVKLSNALFTGANLSGANLAGAIIDQANFTSANLSNADLSGALLYWTVFADTNLQGAKGLESCAHYDRSIVDFHTLLQSGPLDQDFLRGCGLPDQLIEQLPDIIDSFEPQQYSSCFISYSSNDQKFAERLRADLQSKGVRCWYAPEDLRIGVKIRVGIDESIEAHEKLLLILSKHSIESEWVEKEVETAMERERQQKRTILFPIRLDDAVQEIRSGWPADVRRTRNIGDFRRWESPETYSKAFERLLRDLKASA